MLMLCGQVQNRMTSLAIKFGCFPEFLLKDINNKVTYKYVVVN